MVRKGLGRTGLAALAASIAVLAWTPSAHGAYQWSDGLTERSYITNCPSIIFGSPYIEEGAWTWTGQYLDPANPPDINEPFYVHVVAGAVGNSCSGQRVHFELLGPGSGTISTAIDGTHPIICWLINWNTNPPSAQQEPPWPTGACPNFPQSGGIYSPATFDAQTNPSNAADTDPWPLPQGQGWEIQIPITSPTPRSGGFGACNDCNTFFSWLLDGNDSPYLFPRQGLFVNNTTPGGGSGDPGGTGGTGVGLTANPQQPPPSPAAAPTGLRAAALKKCAKKKSKKKKKKCKRAAQKLPV